MLVGTTSRQFYKYLAVGGAANAFGYGVYILLTSLGVGAFLSVSLVYTSACLMSYLANKSWTFVSELRHSRAIPRYVGVQILGYLTNLLMLAVFYWGLGVPHQLVQLVAIVFVGLELFLFNKYYVFR
jgi:putative flippase GtrA